MTPSNVTCYAYDEWIPIRLFLLGQEAYESSQGLAVKFRLSAKATYIVRVRLVRA